MRVVPTRSKSSPSPKQFHYQLGLRPFVDTDLFCSENCAIPSTGALTAAERMEENVRLNEPGGDVAAGGYNAQALCEPAGDSSDSPVVAASGGGTT